MPFRPDGNMEIDHDYAQQSIAYIYYHRIQLHPQTLKYAVGNHVHIHYYNQRCH
jgi:hypothetical protein